MSVILDEAKKVVYERNAAYGQPEDNFAITAELWSAYLGVPIQPEDVGMMMILLKVAREKYQHKHDNLVDIAGYAECVARLHEQRNDGVTRTVTESSYFTSSSIKCDNCGLLSKTWIETKEGKKYCPRCVCKE